MENSKKEKRKKRLLKILSILSCIMIVFTSVSFADSYEYNDFSVYMIGGNAISSGAFTSNTSGLSTFQISIQATSSGALAMAMTGGSYITVNNPSGYYLDVNSIVDEGYITCGGSTYHFVSNNGYIYSQSIPVSGYPWVNIYLPYTASQSSVPSTPILTVDDTGLLSWTPAGYHAIVYYNINGEADGWDELMTDWDKSYYRPTIEADYKVALKYTLAGEERHTALSNSIHVTPVDDNSGPVGPVQAILNLLNRIINGFTNSISTLREYISQLGELIDDLFAFLPDPIQSVYFAVVIVGLVMGLFIK